MYPPVATKDPTAVEIEVQAAGRAMFPKADPLHVPRAFDWARECFTGHYGDYQPVDARYHDFEHTLQGTLCLARLLRARHAAGAQPQLTQRLFELGLLAVLLHDSGYLKRRGDHEGSGAKYTSTHVARGLEFAAQLLREKGYGPADVEAVQNMIRCTDMHAALSEIPFQSEGETTVGYALGTADLLGQMAAEDYVDKLPLLYAELVEAADYAPDQARRIASFSSADDLIRRTPAFWENSVLVKLNRDFGGLQRFLNEPYPHGPNDYLERIGANMQRIRQRLAPANA